MHWTLRRHIIIFADVPLVFRNHIFLEIQFVRTKCEHCLTLNLAQLDCENLLTAISSEGVPTRPVVSL